MESEIIDYYENILNYYLCAKMLIKILMTKRT